jgi:hypothetical protein
MKAPVKRTSNLIFICSFLLALYERAEFLSVKI